MYRAVHVSSDPFPTSSRRLLILTAGLHARSISSDSASSSPK